MQNSPYFKDYVTEPFEEKRKNQEFSMNNEKKIQAVFMTCIYEWSYGVYIM